MIKSLSLAEKLNRKFQDDPVLLEFDALYSLSTSKRGFTNPHELKQHLAEGAMLNVGILASKALSIPCGEYMVWMTDAGHTMLVPVAEGTKRSKEVFEQTTDQYDIFTNTLLNNWNKLEKILSEDVDDHLDRVVDDDEMEVDQGEEKEGPEGEIRTNVNVSTVDRMPILRAMQDRGHTVTSLANAVGVDPPAISRILRTPKDVQGDPKGRNPSMGLASQICSELRLDPTAAFPDIFGAQKYEPRNTPGNRGSGMGGAASGSMRKGAATEKWTQGSTAEEFAKNFDALCEAIALSGMPFESYWESYAFPTLVEGNCQTIHELLNEFRWPFSQKQRTLPTMSAAANQSSAANQQYADRLASRKAAGTRPGMTPEYERRDERFETQKQRMNEKIVAPVKKAFASAMNQFLQQAQELQYQQGVSEKEAPHAWQLAKQFYNAMMQRAAEFQANWKRVKPGETIGYNNDYTKARDDYRSKSAPPTTDPLAS